MKYADLSAAQESWIKEVLDSPDKCLTICNGLRFYFPDARITANGWIVDNTNIRNYPVQSFATADIVPIGIVYAWHIVKASGIDAFFINTVHDSGIGEVRKGQEHQLKELLQYSMIDCVVFYLKKVYGIAYPIPIEIEYEYGPYWSEWIKH